MKWKNKPVKLPGTDTRVALLPRLQGIYQITCLATGERYIGSSVDIEKRWREHVAAWLQPLNPEMSKLSNKYLTKAARTHGIKQMTFQIIEPCFAMTPTEIEIKEYQLIERLKPEFNIKREI